jgi:type VI protein secretion system component Hcp
MRKSLDACTTLLLQALVQQQQMQVILTIFDTSPDDGATRAKTRITLDNARIVGVEAAGDASSADPQMTTTQELARVLAQQVIVEDLIAGTSFQFDFATAR